jgi:hypothetical protein
MRCLHDAGGAGPHLRDAGRLQPPGQFRHQADVAHGGGDHADFRRRRGRARLGRGSSVRLAARRQRGGEQEGQGPGKTMRQAGGHGVFLFDG